MELMGKKLQPRKIICILCLLVVSVLYVLYVISVQFVAIYSADKTKRYQDFCAMQCEKLWKPVIYTNYELPPDFIQSTCSSQANERGPNQRVVSFSFFGDFIHSRQYFKGIERNAQLIRKLYPGWVMRVYHNLAEPEKRRVLCNVACKHELMLDTCFVGNIPGYGNLLETVPMTWRFLVLADPLVDAMLSRDLDSEINAREVAAVSEWYNSSAFIHVMRDHPEHSVPILGGMWGARLQDPYREVFRNVTEVMLNRNLKRGYGVDQTLLADHLWPLAHRPGWLLQHDSYYCDKFPVGNMTSFPTQRLNEMLNFVGSREGVDTAPMFNKCPEKCRRNISWFYC